MKAVLNVHLRREVTEVMPVVHRVLTEKEMQEAGKHGIDQLDKKFLVGYLGMVSATNPLQDQKEMFKETPRPCALPTDSSDAGVSETVLEALPGAPDSQDALVLNGRLTSATPDALLSPNLRQVHSDP